VKKYKLAFLVLGISFTAFFSCKKINESTELGGNLIPGVDNINTFETSLNTLTNNRLFNDTAKVGYSDLVAAGDVNDPQFGKTHANFSFTVTPATLGVNPFVDTLVSIDSVVLYLAYTGAWGDTALNGVQTLRVFEVAQGSTFADTVQYRYNDPASDFAVTTPGTELGSTTYTIRKAATDTISIRRRDTTKVAGVVRIPLSTSLGTRFSQYDTTSNPTKGGYHSDLSVAAGKDGKIFRSLFKGLAVRSENTGNALAFFSLADTKTKLTVYYKTKVNKDTTLRSFDFVHRSDGRANYIRQDVGGSWSAHLNNTNPNDSLIYLQASPSGAYASIVIPDLSSFDNKVIHLAEIVGTIPPQYQSAIYTPPTQLFLERQRNDTLHYIFERDIPVNSLDGSLSLENFGGNLKSNSYRFNITRYVQNVVTRKEANDTLKLYPAFRTILRFGSNSTVLPLVQLLPRVADGRAILAGGSFSDPAQRLRLRIIYSNL